MCPQLLPVCLSWLVWPRFFVSVPLSPADLSVAMLSNRCVLAAACRMRLGRGWEEETHFHLSMLAWEQDPGNLERIVGLDRQEGDSGHVHFWLLTLISYFSLLSLSFLFVK